MSSLEHWTAVLSIRENIESPLVASLATEAEIEASNTEQNVVLLNFCEDSAADLRAIWNTRIRSLIASYNVLQVFE